MPIEQSFNPFVKACHSGIAFVLRSGKAVLCFILAHVHDYHALGFEAWDEGIFAPVVEYVTINIFLKVIKRE